MVSRHDSAPPPPCPASFNLAAYVLQGVAAQPDKIALQILRPTGAERWSYARLEAAIRGTASGLTALGLHPGDRILMRLGNTVDFPILFLGAIAAGLIPVPTSAQLTTPEVTRIAAEITPSLIAAAPGVALPERSTCPALDLPALAALRDTQAGSYVMGESDRLAYIIYTSGTSGRPRAVMHAHRSIWARRMMWDGWYGMTPNDRILHAGAFNWTYTLGTGLLDPWTLGATALIPGDGVTSATMPLLLKRFDATLFAAAPGVYRQILKAPLPALPKLRHGLSAGEKLSEHLRAQWTTATGTPVYEAFGMSECSTFLSGSPASPAPEGSLGYPQPGRRIALLGPDGTPTPLGAPGQIAIDATDPGLFLGYLNAPDETHARFHNGWFLTGDIGQMDAAHAITYLGRADDMMNAGGYRVSPVEVESVMAIHPAIHECAAVEVTVTLDTTVIACFYTGEDVPDADLAGFAAAHLARYKQPRLFVRCDTLPKGANGKLLRQQLRRDYEASHAET
ncbi:MAG: acyl--CoA ligase [Paracoccaceae bacterium]|nr:acyl--CoA ligase [Paracoccaceae bacterium]